MVVPYDDVIESATDMSETVNAGYIGMAITVGCIAIVMAIVGGFTARACAKNIVSQIKDFNDITASITAGKLGVEMGNMQFNSSEFQQIGEKFQMLLNVVQFANSSFFQNNIAKAFECYCKVEAIVDELDNQKGRGVVYNNKANALTQMGTQSVDDGRNHLIEAEKMFDLAISLKYFFDGCIDPVFSVTFCLDRGKDAGDQFDKTVEFFKITLGNRFDNLGHYYFVCGDLQKAYENHDKAIQLHRETDNKLGEMKAFGNKGLVFMADNKPNEAEQMFEEAYKVAIERYNQNRNSEVDVEKNTELLQYASMNLPLTVLIT